MTEQIDATNATEHMADAESTAESAKAAVRGVEETHPEYVDFAVDDFPGGLPACLEAILMVADQPQTATELARILALDRNTVEEALRALHDDYEGDESRGIRPRGFELRRTARGWRVGGFAANVTAFPADRNHPNYECFHPSPHSRHQRPALRQRSDPHRPPG